MTFADQPTRTVAEHIRCFYAGIFGSGIENARVAAGRSIPEAARLAGLELSQWMALEAGTWLPQTPEQLRAIPGALEMEYDRLASWSYSISRAPALETLLYPTEVSYAPAPAPVSNASWAFVIPWRLQIESSQGSVATVYRDPKLTLDYSTRAPTEP